MFGELFQETGFSLEPLHTFCLVAQAGGITKAAKGDPVRQSLFSRQLKELEQYFGIDLVPHPRHRAAARHVGRSELVSQDPNEEPAKVLLARLQAAARRDSHYLAPRKRFVPSA